MTLARVGLSGREADCAKKSGGASHQERGKGTLQAKHSSLLEKQSAKLPREQTNRNAI